MKTLDIGIPAGSNSEHYVALLVSSIENTISKSNSYKYIIGINDRGVSTKFFKEMFEEMNITNYEIVHKVQKKSGISTGHGKCLDIILDKMTADYGVFLDSDVCMLQKEWDQLLIEEIDDHFIIIGSEYHPSDGKIVKFPNVITCLFDVKKFKELDISFVPLLKRFKVSLEESKYYGVEEGQTIFLDTGCHIARVIREAGYDGKILDIVSPRYEDSKGKLVFMKKDMRGEEYQLNGVPISTHVGRSSSRNFFKDSIILSWRSRIQEWQDGKI